MSSDGSGVHREAGAPARSQRSPRARVGGKGPLWRLRRTARYRRLEAPVLGALIWATLWCVRLTTRFRSVGAERLERYRTEGRPVVLAFWHGRAIMLPFMFHGRLSRGDNIWIMNSAHRDGEIITQALGRFGVLSTRGSSSRGAIGGTLGLARKLRDGKDVALIPDGPRGPALQAKAGAVELAATGGAPICPLSFSASRFIRLGGWDRMMLPLPGSRVVCVVGEPIEVPRGRLGRDQREVLRAELQQRLTVAADDADAEVGRRSQG